MLLTLDKTTQLGEKRQPIEILLNTKICIVDTLAFNENKTIILKKGAESSIIYNNMLSGKIYFDSVEDFYFPLELINIDIE